MQEYGVKVTVEITMTQYENIFFCWEQVNCPKL